MAITKVPSYASRALVGGGTPANTLPAKQAVPKVTSPALPKATAIGNGALPYSGVPGQANPATADVPGNFQSYLDAIQNDPVYSSALASFQNQSQASRSSLAAQIGQLVTQGGYDISGALANDPTLSQFAGDVTPTITAAANSNPLSQRAQIEQSYNQGLSDLAYEMAARGTIGSGASSAGASSLLQKSQAAHQTAQQSLIDAIRGGVGNYLSSLSSGQGNLSDIMGQVASRLSQQPGGPLDIGNQTPAATPQAAPPAGAQQPGVMWSNRLFQSVGQMKGYLSSVGVNYNDWARQHPSAASTLELMS